MSKWLLNCQDAKIFDPVLGTQYPVLNEERSDE